MSGRLSSDNESPNNESRCPPSCSAMTTPVEYAALKLGFIGAGNMATAMAKGFLKARLVTPDHVMASARTEVTLKKFQESVDAGVVVTKDNVAVAKDADILFLSVKPQFMAGVLEQIRSAIHSSQIIVSIAAGILISHISDALGDKKICRVMPNTPCLVSEGAAAICCNPQVTEEDEKLLIKFFSKIGKCVKVAQEGLIDSVTGLSGSGPAYVLTLIQAMADGGVKMGLPRAAALELAAQTVKGAACMVLETGKHPAQLIDEIMSPAGTTAFGVHALEGSQGFRNSVINAVEAATQRGRDLKECAKK